MLDCSVILLSMHFWDYIYSGTNTIIRQSYMDKANLNLFDGLQGDYPEYRPQLCQQFHIEYFMPHF